jgi:hypothetical protein
MAVLVVVVAAAVVAASTQPPPPQPPQQQQRWDTYAAAMLGQGSDLHAASFNPDSFLAEAEEWCASTDRCESPFLSASSRKCASRTAKRKVRPSHC